MCCLCHVSLTVHYAFNLDLHQVGNIYFLKERFHKLQNIIEPGFDSIFVNIMLQRIFLQKATNQRYLNNDYHCTKHWFSCHSFNHTCLETMQRCTSSILHCSQTSCLSDLSFFLERKMCSLLVFWETMTTHHLWNTEQCCHTKTLQGSVKYISTRKEKGHKDKSKQRDRTQRIDNATTLTSQRKHLFQPHLPQMVPGPRGCLNSCSFGFLLQVGRIFGPEYSNTPHTRNKS